MCEVSAAGKMLHLEVFILICLNHELRCDTSPCKYARALYVCAAQAQAHTHIHTHIHSHAHELNTRQFALLGFSREEGTGIEAKGERELERARDRVREKVLESVNIHHQSK